MAGGEHAAHLAMQAAGHLPPGAQVSSDALCWHRPDLLCTLCCFVCKALWCSLVSILTTSAFIHCLVLPGMCGWGMSSSAQHTAGPATGLLHACGFCQDGRAAVAMQLWAKD